MYEMELDESKNIESIDGQGLDAASVKIYSANDLELGDVLHTVLIKTQ